MTSNLSYVWYAYTTTTRNEADTLGRERELDVLAELSILTPGEAYTLALKVTDNTTGVFTGRKGNLRCVRSLPKELFFCVKRMVWRKLISSQMMSNTVLEDVYESANKQLLGRNHPDILGESECLCHFSETGVDFLPG